MGNKYLSGLFKQNLKMTLSRRSSQRLYPHIVLNKHNVAQMISEKQLGMALDHRLNFNKH